MDLKEQIMDDVKQAMKNKEADKLATLRFLHSSIKNKEIESRPQPLTDEDVLSVIKKMAKQRRDSIEQYEKAGRDDLVEKEKQELALIEGYLPEPLSREDIEKVVDETISELQAESMKQMGAVMKQVLAKTKGAADNKLVSEIVKSKLH